MSSTDAAPRTRIGLRFEPDWPPEQLPAFARWAESAGFDELWFSEDLPWTGGIAMAATALATTSTLHVGLGLLPVVTRNVATTAMEIATLARLAPGRLTVGLGYGIPSWMDQIGAGVPRRLRAVEETADALRRLLAGDEVTVDGVHVHLDAVRLGLPPADVPPIVLGSIGPAGIAAAARTAQGVLLPEIASPAAVTAIRDALGGAGGVQMLAMLSLGDDRGRAVAQTRERMQRIVDFRVFDRLAEMAGLGADGSGELTDEILHTVAATGTPADCARSIDAWIAAGAESVVLVAGSDDPIASYERFAKQVLPLYAARR